ncbi:YqjK-like family protein [Erwinia psidii]|uniref:Cell division protein FtsH n=1 Tax=Erwinia psidii TaxID=69224 RepID=A0A3N6UQ36_9GAMM|nr:YqjK-like family protein [Erwinia psidii]MCX8958200.1 hypothetical protein [Erwinia psidii]MCX8963121.1 hypothetical protein [Erwinia psidii]MCX8966937.1 hypothetical protein [Erwinia psidii]RQM38069.1 hypothetical protein EB241_12400 [Erwinia psidii]
MSRELARRKTELLRQVQQQRLDLSAEKKWWLESTARYDSGWLTLVSLRRYLAVGSSLMAVWSIRHPRRITRWARRGLGIWSTWRMVRNYLPRS